MSRASLRQLLLRVKIQLFIVLIQTEETQKWRKMLKKPKKAKQKQRRPIEDVPFYKFEYKFDDLPLDPARPFILEQISTSFAFNGIESSSCLKTLEFQQPCRDLQTFFHANINSNRFFFFASSIQCLINEMIFQSTRSQANLNSQNRTNFSTTLIYIRHLMATGSRAQLAFSFPIFSKRTDKRPARMWLLKTRHVQKMVDCQKNVFAM